ncbi:flagellin [Paenibacillus sp. LjRoot56]|uniref:flagellin N-terminal helical domain-containing protein n=1 Tax=Paenibacillus sp. LjRoot56 TaxID=3342333 RepID=UPI003ECFCE0C
MRINHNLPALNTYRQLTSNQAASVKSTEKLSSGLRINRAGDDAAGLAISEKMRGQIRGLDQASRNSQDAISMIQTAEGALNETHDILQRMRELSVQASTDTNTASDRGEIQKEINSLTSEINRIGNTTEFNTQKLLNGEKANSEIGITKSLVGASGFASSVAVGGSGTAALAAGNTLSNADYSLSVTSSAFTGSASGLSAGSGATAVAANVSYSAGKAVFSGNNITFTATAGTALDATTSGTLKLTYSSGVMKLDFSGSGNATFTSGTQLNDTIIADASGKFTYNSNGISFTITDVGNMASGDTITYVLSGGTATANTASTLWTNLSLSGTSPAPSATLTTTSGAKLGNYTVNFVDNGSSGDLKITFSGTDGSTQVLDVLEGVSSSGATTYSGYGINIAFTGLSGITNGGSGTMKFSVTGTEYTATLKDAAGTSVGTANLGSAGVSGLSTSVSANVGGVQVSFTSGDVPVSGVTTISVRGQESAVAKSGESSVNFQIGANQNQSMSLEIADMRSNALGITRTAAEGSLKGFTSAVSVSNGTNNTNNEFALDVSTASNASNAITVIQSAIDKVSSERSKLGAYQNRLEHTINNLGTSSENLTASESRIRDVDMAKEMMNNTRNNILQQAAQAMLAQANQAPQQVLQLLR